MKLPEIIIIAALAEANRVIGKNGQLPWRIPEDSQRFKRLTSGYAVIMGRKTWEFDLQKKPLLERHNIIVSSSPQPNIAAESTSAHPHLSFVASLQDGLTQANESKKVFIMGGARLYAEGLTLADTLELTLVAGDFEGDTFFPEYDHLVGTQFELVKVESHPGFRFETYQRFYP
ncbi:MAG: dihydrofolate reductase [Leptolyngbyaceae cyanobacterium MO_188.B28]|nr:dihydrofolate reductase [Leptolyngbyaceae cyanobacterium MO_188.B28]